MRALDRELLSLGAAHLYYVHDPMCSWCWAFNPVWEILQARLQGSVEVVYVLGGLASDSEDPMAPAMRKKIENIWRDIEIEVPGTRFNFDFWKVCTPRRSTYMACRAVIAAHHIAPDFGLQMIRSIQMAYYLHAQNPSDKSVLIDLAVKIGMDREQFAKILDAEETDQELRSQIHFARKMGVWSFPALVLHRAGFDYQVLKIDYLDAKTMLEQIRLITESETGSG